MVAEGGRRERIVVLSSSFPEDALDGAGHFVATEVEQLANAGHAVTVLFPARHREKFTRDIEATGGRIELRPFPGGELFGFPGALARAKESPPRLWHLVRSLGTIKRFFDESVGSIDRIIAHWIIPGAFPWAVLSGREIPLEVVAHGSDVRLFLALPRPLRVLLLRHLDTREAVLRFVSQELKSEVARSGLPSDLANFIGRSVVSPAALSFPEVPDRVEARRRLGIDRDVRLAVVVSRLIPEKRVSVALASLTLVPHLAIVVVGDGPELTSLRQAYPEARFVGKLPRGEALCWMSASDLLVSASRAEGAPTVVREAQKLGTAVVCVDAGDLLSWAQADDSLWVID